MASQKRFPKRFFVVKAVTDSAQQQVELDLVTTLSINDQVDRYKCFVRGNWYWSQLGIEVGDTVNVLDPIEEKPKDDASEVLATLIVDNDNGLIVVQPDMLISTTALMNSSYCMRKAWLSRVYQGGGDACKAFLIGNIVHELFQECLRANKLSVSEVDEYFKKNLLNSATLTLYELGMSQADLISEIQPYIKSISYWLETYLSKSFNDKRLFLIQRLYDIENSIWSTRYGLIGKIDVTLEIIPRDLSIKVPTRSLVPLELKTGKSSFSAQHSGQVILYSAIMAEKHPHLKSIDGYLVYLKDETKTELVKGNRNTFRDIMVMRNKFVRFYDRFSNASFKEFFQINDLVVKGPEPTYNTRSCERCEHQLDCALTYKCFDSKLLNNQNFEIATTATAHLSPDDFKFFTDCITLLEVEKQHAITSEKSAHFWNIRSEDCERSLIGLSKMQIKFQGNSEVTFSRSSRATEMLPLKLLTANEDATVNYALFEDRRVVISEELVSSLKTYELYGSFCKQLCVAIGSVNRFSNEHSVIEIVLEKEQLNRLNSNAVFRIDFLQNLSNRPMAINFSNILRLMSPEDERCRELRDIVIRGRFPEHNINTCKISSFSKIFESPVLSHLNPQQRRAILGVLKTRCSLIFGSPGSGKTATIVALLQILVQLGFSVLVTTYTHVAVDNILLKLAKANVDDPVYTDFLRVGSMKRIHSQLKEYSDSFRTKDYIEKGDLASLESLYRSVPIVAATCLGIDSHPIFAQRQFDFCILDEASQVFLATSLGPIYRANNFVLVGDQKQLPPVIQNPFARKNGLEESLFARLLKFADKENILASGDTAETFERFEDYVSKQNVNQIDGVRIFPLFIQYRMNLTIMALANKLTYSGKLRCANDEIERATLNHFLKPENTDTLSQEGTSLYLSKAISASLDDAVIFMDTCGIAKAVENSAPKSPTDSGGNLSTPTKSSIGGYVYNNFEAIIISRLIQTLLSIYGKGGLTGADIGVISPFQRQVAHIKEVIGAEIVNEKHIEINTVDQYQGRDKEVIIYSCVKSSDDLLDSYDSQPSSLSTIVDSELLKDERRLNVAVTRAKKKLIIIGNRRTLDRYPPFQSMFLHLNSSQFVPLVSLNCDDVIHSMD
ncbi:PREDICTED: DNA replication ATP-dependent helicase/nuclease DNA2-like [Rhagoletis zephyria]|uniref:DNA replication ATP-dependent helicase/nuclease DNA2-like n=1 Tax=Rhagoletis zephyria TaxID=28612 RepID=UPI0008117E0C|nr:PREDICTED: DNA replication ATP-dependent helicase/nuclease DNA2-like [Rhagoletis zephyria]